MAKKAVKKKPAARAAGEEGRPLRLEWRTAEELAENPRNWRRHPEKQMRAIEDAIDEVGWAGACLYNERTGRLIDGHARRKIAKGKIPVLVGSWSEADEAKILATLDPIGAMARADKPALDALLREFETPSEALAQLLTEQLDLAGTLDDGATAEEAAPAAEPPAAEIDRAGQLLKKWKVKPGQLWTIAGAQAEHRLLCGDSTKAEDVARVMSGEKAALCFTSPPYAQQRDYTAESKAHTSDWDGMMRGVFGNLPMADDGQVLVNLGLVHREGEWWPYWDGWIEWMRSQGWRRFAWYVWDQGPGMAGDWGGRLAPSFEMIFHFNRASKQPHPVGLPLAILSSWPGHVYEPFAGSGTTLVAAEQLSRRCFGIEIAPQYCAVILERMAKVGCTPRLEKATA